MKQNKLFVVIWNGLVGMIPFLLPLIIQHKDTIIRTSNKIKIK